MGSEELFTYVTGNARKLRQVKQLVDFNIASADISLVEIQSLNAREVAEHKAREAYSILKRPVLVEDTSLEIVSLGGLPGTLVKWFLQSIGPEGICRLVSGDRKAIARNIFAFFDGETCQLFEGSIAGHISTAPRVESGFGWDTIFINEGNTITRAEMSDIQAAESSGRVAALKLFTAFITTYAKQ